MERQPSLSQPRSILLVLLWIIALIGYFSPWIGQAAAALAWNGFDLFAILRFLPQIETFKLIVNLQALRLPLLGLAVWLPWCFAQRSWPWRWGAALLGILLAAMTLPPYPYILSAWRTPGWHIPFWWGIGGMCGCLLSAAVASRLRWLRPWLLLAWTALTTLPALVTFQRLLPALRELYGPEHPPLYPGWGVWLYASGALLLALRTWLWGIVSQVEEES